jgi:tRNA pseudouridine55 synthase
MSALSGVIILDKPGGISSNAALGRLKRLLAERKMGFLGTLDPLATGVLPVFVGKATRLIPFFEELDKTYRVTLRLGVETDSYDSHGKVVREQATSHLLEADVRPAILSFQGQTQQRPPAFSAVKQGGVPAYRAARRGQALKLPVRTVRIQDIRIESVVLPDVTFTLTCSAGTYVRSLAHDIGQKLGTGAVVTALRRLRSGDTFTLERARSLDEIGAAAQDERLDFLLDPAALLTAHAPFPVSPDQEGQLRRGQMVPLPADTPLRSGTRMKAVRPCGTLVAVGETTEMPDGRPAFRPSKVLI